MLKICRVNTLIYVQLNNVLNLGFLWKKYLGSAISSDFTRPPEGWCPEVPFVMAGTLAFLLTQTYAKAHMGLRATKPL